MTYDPADNAARCYALAIALMREKRIRVPDDQLESRMGL